MFLEFEPASKLQTKTSTPFRHALMRRLTIAAKGMAQSLMISLIALSGHANETAARAHTSDVPRSPDAELGPAWLAGDHHIHSRYSVGWNNDTNPPTPILGGDAIYPIAMNAVMARQHGLDWMVTTDHGGPNHSRVHLNHAYPELLESREAVPDVIQFLGMEFDTPAADHTSLIFPQTDFEIKDLVKIEEEFNSREFWPADPGKNTEQQMLLALSAMKRLPAPPLLIAHHPSRSASGLRQYGKTTPREMRSWNDQAPNIAVGMEGSPGHQAITQSQERFGPSKLSKYLGDSRPRGIYGSVLGGHPTMGGFDQMTAVVGGFWDSMLGEGRRWWITANSDSHTHWRDGGADFWPGEYSKTYVYALKNPASIFAAIRAGRMFVVTGDLISALAFRASSKTQTARIGQSIAVDRGGDIDIYIEVVESITANAGGRLPKVKRVDLIRGKIDAAPQDLSADENATARVQERFFMNTTREAGTPIRLAYKFENVQESFYVRLRGTNGEEREPLEDPDGEDPWSDLWFYSNPIFVEVSQSGG